MVKTAATLLAMIVLVSTTRAEEYTVAPGEAIGPVAAELKAGDTLRIQAGVYTESLTLTGLKGKAGAPIVITGEGAVTLRPTRREGIIFWGGGGSSHVVIEGLTIRGASRAGIIVNGSHDITIRNCAITDNGKWGVQTCLSDAVTVERCRLSGSRAEHGVYFSTTDHPVVRACKIHDNAACGIHFNGDKNEGGDGMITGALVENNMIFRNGQRGGAAINMDGVEKSVIRNNLLFSNHAGGIVSFCQDAAAPGARNRFLNNTVYFKPRSGRFGLSIRGRSRGLVIRQNILVFGEGPVLQIDEAAFKGLTCDRNVYFAHGKPVMIEQGVWKKSMALWQENTEYDSHSIAADPQFVNPARSNYSLQKDSPALRLGAGHRWKRP